MSLRKSFPALCTSGGSVVKRTVIYTGPSVQKKYEEALKKLNIGLAGHVTGGALMLLSSSFIGPSPLPAAVFAGLLWMQVMSTAKVTELGAWVNLAKNVVKIERIQPEGEEQGELKEKETFAVYTDGAKLVIKTEPRPLGDDGESETSLPTLKQLKSLGILHIDDSALGNSDPVFQSLLASDDTVVTMNETVRNLQEPPPGAERTKIPKLAEIFQRRQKAIHGDNKRIAAIIANAPPMDPSKMIDRLGTASMAMGGAVFVLGAGLYLASSSYAATHPEPSRKPE